MSKIVVSGVQTSGTLHLGNYLGSVKRWLSMQDQCDCYFFLADLHSLTVEYDPQELQQSIIHCAAMYLAIGLDPVKSTIFQQSQVQEHCQFAWILNCMTPIGWLSRMTQFKDKTIKNQESANVGLFTYPVLMAADILLYNADLVPVGDDQKQHLELVRDIAGAINRRFNEEVLRLPEPLISGATTRVMSLRDGKKKMSKSDASDASRINLTDDADTIRAKIKKSKTDSILHINFDAVNRPEIANMINIYSDLATKTTQEVVDIYANKGCMQFKSDLADLIIANLQPIKYEFDKIMQDKNFIQTTLNIGKEKAQIVAHNTYTRVVEKLGMIIGS